MDIIIILLIIIIGTFPFSMKIIMKFGINILDKVNEFKAKSNIKNDKDHVLYEEDIIKMFPELKELPQFTFDDVLALQCVMETVKKVQEDKDLYEKLQSLHDRVHDAYWLEKQDNKPQGKSALEASKEEKVDNQNCVKPANKANPKFKIEQNPVWSKEDEVGLGEAMWAIKQARTIVKDENDMGNLWYAEKWLKSIKEKKKLYNIQNIPVDEKTYK